MDQTRRGFTVIELLTVISIIAVLVALLMPAIGLVRERSRATAARLLVQQVHAAADLYRSEEPLRRFPTARADRTLRWDGSGATVNVGDQLAVRGLAVSNSNTASLDSGLRVLADPWGQALMYEVDEHVSGDGIAVMPRDAAGDRVRVPDDVTDWNPPRGTPARSAVPYAYVWSWGRPATGSQLRSKAASWIYVKQEAAR